LILAKKKTKKAVAAATPAAAKPAKAQKQVGPAFAGFLANVQKKYPGVMETANLLAQVIPRISTGNLGLDIATYGGLPRGRIIRFYGREKSAKTGSCLNTIASWQKHCGTCYERGPCPHGKVSGVDRPKAQALWIDAEHRLDSMMHWVEGHGIDLDYLLIMEPPSGQHITDITDAAIREHGANIGLIIVDSIAHFTSQEEIDKATVKGRTGPVNALLVNRALRKWVAAVNFLGVAEPKKPTIILINQLRSTMDQYKPEAQPGGKAADYATSIDIRFSHGKVHYLVPQPGGGFEDKQVAFGTRWKPEGDGTPDYIEIHYRVTASGICPNGRYGEFNYWLHEAHGRRKGDPDNMDRLWEYARKYLMVSKKDSASGDYEICAAHASTQAALKNAFYADDQVQLESWAKIVSKLIEV